VWDGPARGGGASTLAAGKDVTMRGEPPAARDRLPVRLRRRCRAAARFAKRLLGAVVIGAAALFVPKTLPDQHWSDPPIITMIADYDQAVRQGAPPDPTGRP
jgi:hypothetical protein